MNTINSLMRTNNNNNSVQQKTPTKKTKPKKKNTAHPVKVVYISNPMKIKTSAAEFRALVQELTGQDAESPPDPSRFHALHPDSDDSSVKNVDVALHDKFLDPPPLDPNNFQTHHQHQHQQLQQQEEEPSSFEALDDDDIFTPQMIDNISSLLPASVFYESPHLSNW